MKDQIIYLPGKAKAFIFLLVAIIFSCSVGLVAYLLIVHPSGTENVVAASIALANTCAAAVGFLVVLTFSRLSVDVNGLREKTDRFFVSELPGAFPLVDYKTPDFSKTAAKELEKATLADCAMSFVRGTNLATYRISAFGFTQQLNVMLNVRRLVISYHFPADTDLADPRFVEIFDYTIKAAEHTGYQTEWRNMPADALAPARVELRTLVNLPDDFLVNAVDRLFWSNDVAIMTRAVMKCRKAYAHERGLTLTPDAA